MSTRRMRTKRTTSGSSRFALVLLCAVALFPVLSGKDKKKKAAEPEPYGVIAGTVFRGDGFALAGAEITVIQADTANAADKPQHIKNLKTAANDRGEFAVRVPAVPAKYRIDVKLRGFEPQSKDVSIEGEQRKEVNFLLEAAK
jgi:hypothetical protein